VDRADRDDPAASGRLSSARLEAVVPAKAGTHTELPDSPSKRSCKLGMGPRLRGDDAFAVHRFAGAARTDSTVRPKNFSEIKMQTTNFELTSEFIELNQLLKLVGVVDSGGAGKHVVASGAVSVDGKKELRKTAKIRAGQTVTLGDIRINVR
jgi:ribosome-associated protein